MPGVQGMPVSVKPLDYGTGGIFRIARRFVPAASQTAGVLWTFRNPHATKLVVINRIRLRVLQVGAPTAAIEDQFSVKFARSYTVADNTGAVSIAPASAMQKLRTDMGNSVVQIQETNAAGGISGGTKTLDANPIINGGIWVVGAVQTTPAQEMNEVFDYHERVMVCATNEGFVISNDNALGTASGITIYLTLDWSEVDSF